MSISVTDELCLLLIEDNPGDATLFEHHLTTNGNDTFPPATVTHVEELDAGIEELETDAYDLVLLDLGLPDSSGLDTLDRYNDAVETHDELAPVPVVVLTGLKDDAASVEAIERGAQDYLVKDNVDSNILHRTIRYALERHRQEQELRRQNERLERFANVVSHDLRNPLGVAKGRLEMLEENQHTPIIAKNLNRMEAIIEDVLTLAREGQSVEETSPVDLSTLVTDCWESVETGSAAVSVDDGIVIEADQSRLQQLIENLLRNSIEHVGDEVSIHVGSLPDGFYFEDDGPGIPAEDHDVVFDAGFTTNQDGTGFGLNIVKESAEAHGWDVSVTDGSNGGARFEFTGVTVLETG
ncbi:hybrid sensor histidine kinase/response regulator [Halonotius terrestris]|uniref:histidine kinase n=1 Tax=Halonotius terrestris TaxID=2487750 RepID=A0A8J8PCR7_9EURY|nr:hybrid sensor histidine kinase/response regulator [Halonotius terrestris]TQQ82797.1 hybrid sensor histidine kinase/response regulator [Halonotius terrestris]